MKVDGLKCHDTLVKTLKQKLSYGTNPDYKAWKHLVWPEMKRLMDSL